MFTIKRKVNESALIRAAPCAIGVNNTKKPALFVIKFHKFVDWFFLFWRCIGHNYFLFPRLELGIQPKSTLPVKPLYVKRRPMIDGTAFKNRCESVISRSLKRYACSSK